MLTLRVEGDTHPKQFYLVTDDHDGELHRLQEIVHEEIGAPADDPIRAMLDQNSADQFAEGVRVPDSEVGDLAEILEGDWWEAAEIIYKQRQDALDQIEAEASESKEGQE